MLRDSILILRILALLLVLTLSGCGILPVYFHYRDPARELESSMGNPVDHSVTNNIPAKEN